MIRIYTSDEPSLTTIAIDGNLTEPCIQTVESCYDQAFRKGKKAVRIHLRQITRMDSSGLALLGRLAAKGVELIATGIYTSYVVESIRQEQSPAKKSSVLSAGR